MKLPLKGAGSQGLQPLRDLDQVRSFLSTVGPAALFDLPWMPLYLAICYLFHPLIGIVATAGGADPGRRDAAHRDHDAQALGRGRAFHAGGRNGLAEASRRNAEAVHAMGMAGRLGALWSDCNRNYMAAQQRAADIAGGFGGLSKVLRMALQSGVLGARRLAGHQPAGHGRHHHRELDPDLARARADRARDLPLARLRGGAAELAATQRASGQDPRGTGRAMALPRPEPSLAVEAVSVVPPGTQRVSSCRTWRSS